MSVTPSLSPSAPLRLSNLHLRIGQPVQVVVHGPQTYKHYTKLIGFVEAEYLILQLPVQDGWPVPLTNGQRLDVRVFSGVSIYDFSSVIDFVQLHPRNLMVLSYPESIRETRLREHERVSCDWPVQIRTAQGPWMAAHLQDLSGGGAAVVAAQALATVGESVTLRLNFSLAATGGQEDMEMSATVMSASVGEAAPDPVHRLGVRFEQIDPRILLWVHELHKRRV